MPMAAIFDYAMGTPSGHAAFLDPDVNKMLKKILNEWGTYLKVDAKSLFFFFSPFSSLSSNGDSLPSLRKC